MPQILIVTDSPQSAGEVVYRERISSADLESDHFSGQLVERVDWAVRDANDLEHSAGLGAAPPQRRSLRAAPEPRAAESSSIEARQT